MILHALQVNISVFFVSPDVVFLKNPLVHLRSYGGYDVVSTRNTCSRSRPGFHLIHPTKASVSFTTRHHLGTVPNILSRVFIKPLRYGVLDDEAFCERNNDEEHSSSVKKKFLGCSVKSSVAVRICGLDDEPAAQAYLLKEQLWWSLDQNEYVYFFRPNK